MSYLFYYFISDIVIYLIYIDLMRKRCQLINVDVDVDVDLFRNMKNLKQSWDWWHSADSVKQMFFFLHMRGAENWNLRRANLDTNLGETRLPSVSS